jgi:hypothetical protein
MTCTFPQPVDPGSSNNGQQNLLRPHGSLDVSKDTPEILGLHRQENNVPELDCLTVGERRVNVVSLAHDLKRSPTTRTDHHVVLGRNTLTEERFDEGIRHDAPADKRDSCPITHVATSLTDIKAYRLSLHDATRDVNE